MADRLVEHFVSAGLMVREWDRVKLHGTVMNTLFRKDSTGRGIYTLFYIIGSHCALVSCYWGFTQVSTVGRRSSGRR